ncbi:MAG: SDR family oxidoreductase [Bacteroidia bacterium]|nr:SDR family oxidoreductase [Bacteroidia bacterium]
MTGFKETYGFSEKEWENCLHVLQQLKNNPLSNPDNEQFSTLLTKVHKTAKKQLRQAKEDQAKEADKPKIRETTITRNALNNVSNSYHQPQTETGYSKLENPGTCYSCNDRYELLHSFYHRLCPRCAEFNFAYRSLCLDLSDRRIILTGGRVKIGYATALRLLRNGAHVTVTTRFPALALEQYQKENDYSQWKNRLTVYGLDLRNLAAVEDFVRFYTAQNNRLDALINNAAQTIRYPDAYYQPLVSEEAKLLDSGLRASLSPNQTPVLDNASVALLSSSGEFGNRIALNRFGQPVDYRDKNSWNSLLEEVPTQEMLEVNLINHIAPFMLIQQLTPLLETCPANERFIINVTSSEGQFSYPNKNAYHPHTNMTKAALNMLTRTSAMSYAKRKVYMTSVDVGWVSTGAHEEKRKKQFESGKIPPLDSVDGASRILHPLHEAIENKLYLSGVLLKDFKTVEW